MRSHEILPNIKKKLLRNSKFFKPFLRLRKPDFRDFGQKWRHFQSHLSYLKAKSTKNPILTSGIWSIYSLLYPLFGGLDMGVRRGKIGVRGPQKAQKSMIFDIFVDFSTFTILAAFFLPKVKIRSIFSKIPGSPPAKLKKPKQAHSKGQEKLVVEGIDKPVISYNLLLNTYKIGFVEWKIVCVVDPFAVPNNNKTKNIARAKKSWWLRVLTSQNRSLWAKISQNGQNLQDWPKKGLFSYNFPKVLKNLGGQNRAFFRFFQFCRGGAGDFWKNWPNFDFRQKKGGQNSKCRKIDKNVKNHRFLGLLGSLDPILPSNLQPIPTTPEKGVKWAINWPKSHLLVLDFWSIFAFKYERWLIKSSFFWPKSLKSGFLRPFFGLKNLLLRSSFFFVLEKISCDLTFIYNI